jgi:WD40 repeat protein
MATNKKGEFIETSPDELPVSHIRWKSNKRILVSNVEGFLIEYDINENCQIASLREEDNQILAMDYSHELNRIVTGGKDACVRIYDDNTKRIVRTYEKGSWYSPGHSNRVFATKFKNREPNMVISGGWDSAVFIWDIREPKSVAAFVGPNVSGDTIDTREDVLLIGSHRARESLELWDFGSRKKICDIEIEPGKTVISS